MTSKSSVFDEASILVIAVILLIIVGMLIAIFTIPFHAFLLKVAWNYVMPSLFNLPKITFWQSLALVVIFRILIKSSVSNTNHSKS